MQTPSRLSNPPFLLTYWNPFNEKAPGLRQSFLNYVKDVSIANYTANLVGSHIDNASRGQISDLQDGFGFLNQRLTGIRQEQINTNILIKNIGLLLKLPDTEKQRQLYIERGLKFSIQSLRDEDIAIDAKNELENALKLMPQDWFVLQQLAILLLYNEKVLDVSLAKVYFLKAAKYAKADSETEGITFINSLFNQNLSSPFEGKDNTENGLKVFVREAYLNAALAAYILADFNEAANISKRALTIDSEDSKSLFFAAKYLARDNKKQEAFTYLKKAITNSPSLCIATYADEDLKTIPEALDFCKNFSTEFLNRIELIKTRIDEIKEFINNSIVFQLKNELNQKNFLFKGFELLEQPLIDATAEYQGKDALFNKAVLYTAKRLLEYDPNSGISEYKVGEKVYAICEDWDRQKKVFEQIDYSILISCDESADEITRKKAIEDFLQENLQIKLDGYFVKDLYAKWNEINAIFENRKQIQKEKELQRIEEENQKLLQRKKDEKLSKPILDYYEKKKFTEAWKEIIKVRNIYPKNEYLISLEKMIDDKLSGKLLRGWIFAFLIVFFVYCGCWVYFKFNFMKEMSSNAACIVVFGISIIVATFITIKRSKIIRPDK